MDTYSHVTAALQTEAAEHIDRVQQPVRIRLDQAWPATVRTLVRKPDRFISDKPTAIGPDVELRKDTADLHEYRRRRIGG
jgi:hypothetical protein